MHVMVMIAPNSLIRQEGAQGEDASTGPTPSGVPDAGERNRRNHGRWCVLPLHRRGRGG